MCWARAPCGGPAARLPLRCMRARVREWAGVEFFVFFINKTTSCWLPKLSLGAWTGHLAQLEKGKVPKLLGCPMIYPNYLPGPPSNHLQQTRGKFSKRIWDYRSKERDSFRQRFQKMDVPREWEFI